jgi:hypothetical protein
MVLPKCFDFFSFFGCNFFAPPLAHGQGFFFRINTRSMLPAAELQDPALDFASIGFPRLPKSLKEPL